MIIASTIGLFSFSNKLTFSFPLRTTISAIPKRAFRKTTAFTKYGSPIASGISNYAQERIDFFSQQIPTKISRNQVMFSTMSPSESNSTTTSEKNLSIKNEFAANGNVHNNHCAKLVPSSDDSLRLCSNRLAEGSLVSFPTETVYGLGCNAISSTAVHKVFEAKRRPLTDPLIIHVLNSESALKLWNIPDSSSTVKEVLTSLSKNFFPGPLTIVAKCNKDIVPDVITAGTGYVAVRSPSHPIARKLIEWSGVPIAAPSANRFGHVSPTKSIHVMQDLALEDVWVVNEKNENKSDEKDDYLCCNVGVESTVAKVDETLNLVSILRQGAVSARDIQICLEKAGLDEKFKVDVRVKTTSEQVANIAPGQTVRHYSPDVVSFMISEKLWLNGETKINSEELKIVEKSVILDFGRKLNFLKDRSLAYRDLSSIGDSKEGAANVFDYLRWAELVDGAERVFFPELVVDEKTDALTLAVKDRLTRAASGIVIENFQ